MQTITRNTLKLTIALVVLVAMFGAGFHSSVAYAATCTPTVFQDLYALSGTTTLYGTTSVNFWGYSKTASGASLPGPVLEFNQGDCVQVTLYNVDIPENTSLLFQGQEMIPDTVGVAQGGSMVYTFTASRPGTFLYEAGLIPGAQHQVAMGLYGALVVRPVDGNNVPITNQAYASPTTTFTSESVLVLSEIDPSLNANPVGFDMRKYAPRYFLVNGKAYPDTASIFVAAGDIVLLRYVNAGLQSHAMSSLGVAQKVIATDGSPFAYPHSMVAETIATGQTLDTLVTIPASASLNTKYPIYDANMMLRNSGGSASGLGGMLTFLTVGTPPPPGPDTTGPLLSSITLAPNPSNGTVSVNLSFNADDTYTGGNNVTAAEYWIDAQAPTSITVGTPAPVCSSVSCDPIRSECGYAHRFRARPGCVGQLEHDQHHQPGGGQCRSNNQRPQFDTQPKQWLGECDPVLHCQ